MRSARRGEPAAARGYSEMLRERAAWRAVARVNKRKALAPCF